MNNRLQSHGSQCQDVIQCIPWRGSHSTSTRPPRITICFNFHPCSRKNDDSRQGV